MKGYCGYHLQTDFGLKVERITALDRKYSSLFNKFVFIRGYFHFSAAEPFFGETDEIVRLDTSDANCEFSSI